MTDIQRVTLTVFAILAMFFIVTVVFDNAKYRNKTLTNKFFFWLQVWDLEGAQLLLAMILWLIWRNDKND